MTVVRANDSRWSKVRCPFCHSEDVGYNYRGPLYWANTYDVLSDEEWWACKRCGREFIISGTYQMTGYVAYDENKNEIEDVALMR